MQNSYNCRNIVTDKYSNNNQAAKSASVLSNSMKMANKPLFLVAAAMLMLIFFIGTVHAASPVTLSISPGSVAVDSGNPAVVQYMKIGRSRYLIEDNLILLRLCYCASSPLTVQMAYSPLKCFGPLVHRRQKRKPSLIPWLYYVLCVLLNARIQTPPRVEDS